MTIEYSPGMQEFWRRMQDTSTERGLYLCVRGTDFLDLSVSAIQSAADTFWNHTAQADMELKQSCGFSPCDVCSHYGEDFLCLAIRVFLPLLKTVDGYTSFDEALAGYRDDKGISYIVNTSMQRALQFVVQFGILGFCDVGQHYQHWFVGTHPLMSTIDVAKRIHLNHYWLEKGDAHTMQVKMDTFIGLMRTVIHCQLNRIGLVASSDALTNALVNFDLVTKLMNRRVAREIAEEFAAYQKFND